MPDKAVGKLCEKVAVEFMGGVMVVFAAVGTLVEC